MPDQPDPSILNRIVQAALGPQAHFWPNQQSLNYRPPAPPAQTGPQFNPPSDIISALTYLASPGMYEKLSQPLPGANPEAPSAMAAMQQLPMAMAGGGEASKALGVKPPTMKSGAPASRAGRSNIGVSQQGRARRPAVAAPKSPFAGLSPENVQTMIDNLGVEKVTSLFRASGAGETAGHWTKQQERAGSYVEPGRQVREVVVPESTFQAGRPRAAQLGQPTPHDTFLDPTALGLTPQLRSDIQPKATTIGNVGDIPAFLASIGATSLLR